MREKSKTPPSLEPNRTRRHYGTAIAIAIPVAAILALYIWWPRSGKPALSGLTSKQAPVSKASPSAESSLPSHDLPAGHPGVDDSGSLLEQMKQTPSPDTADLSGRVATTKELEAQYATIAENQEQVNKIRSEVAKGAESKKKSEVQGAVERGKPLLSLLNLRLAAFQQDLTAARRARPNDPVVQWLTGELFLIVGGEPEDILPYLNRAASAHLEQPHLFVSLATVEFDLNHFQRAYSDASKAISMDPKGHAAWDIYSRAGFAEERFVEVLEKISRAFPEEAPDWAVVIRHSAEQLQKSWLQEMAQRKRDQRQGDLPLVRLVVEHRNFVGPADGNAEGSVKVVGRGDVLLELFEDQAPATVSNFVHLVETGFYDGTSFYWAEAGHMVVGGDPNTKNADPADDGLGGAGYRIPDEFNSPNARGHFRGTISMVQNAPGKASSQFFISLVPSPEFDGNTTAFGRVIQGQEVLDQVTEGRTNRNVGEFGKIIPGDRIVHAQVVRKRPHPYVVTKLNTT